MFGGFEADHHIKRRSLSRTIRTEQADYFSLGNLQSDIIDNAATTVCFLEIMCGERGFGWRVVSVLGRKLIIDANFHVLCR